MKNKIFISLFLLLLASFSVFSGTVSVTITYGGAQSQGCCNICGQDYWCSNNPYGCGTTAPCYARSFIDPVPSGNIITGVSVLYYAAGCYASSFPSYINGCYIGAAPTNSQCQCGSCTSYSFSNPSFSCGMPCYNYGGSNSFSICPNGPSCFQRAIVTFTYSSSVGLLSFTPSSASASPNPICGGSTTLSVNGGSLGAGANWNWYSGSCGGALVGVGSSISVSPSSTTTYFVNAVGTCNTTACAQVTVTVNTPSIAPSSASASPNPTCGGATTLT